MKPMKKKISRNCNKGIKIMMKKMIRRMAMKDNIISATPTQVLSSYLSFSFLSLGPEQFYLNSMPWQLHQIQSQMY